MSIAKKLMTVGAEKDVYADDVFSTYLYTGNGAKQSIVNGINLGDFGGGTSTEFDGESDYLSRSSDFVGNSDSAAVTISFWAFLAKEDIQARVYSVGNTYVTLDPGAQVDGAVLNVYLNDGLGSAGSNQFSLRTLNRLDIPYGQWNHILVSLHKQTGQYSIYVNDTAVSSSQIANEFTNNNLADFTQSTHTVMAQNNGTVEGKGKFAHLYMDYTYRDLSNYLNRRPFITVDGGSTPPSTLAALSPIMYLPMVSGYAVSENLGTGGDFDVNGSPEIVDAGTEYVAGSGEGGLVWLKGRSKSNFDHILVDTERGVNRVLKCNTADAEITKDCLTSFNSDGFSLGNSLGFENDFGTDFTSWTFRKAPKFFDVVTWLGDLVPGREIPHSLGVEPGMVFIKKTDGTNPWYVWNKGAPNGLLRLDTTAAIDTDYMFNVLGDGNGGVSGNVILPSSTSITVGTNVNNVYNDGTPDGIPNEYVAYLFAHDDSDESLIKCGLITDNGLGGSSQQYPYEIDLGWEPQFILTKRSDGIGNWQVFDTMRGIPTGSDKHNVLRPNLADAESTSNNPLDITATGFTVHNPFALEGGSRTADFVYMAIRRPNKPAEEFGPEELFAVDSRGGSGSPPPSFYSGFVVDAQLRAGDKTSLSDGTVFFDRIRGDIQGLQTYGTGVEYSAGSTVTEQDQMEGVGSNTAVDSNDVSWMWRRAPGFFDVVCYEGDGQLGREVPHNLSVAPEMILVKSRNNTTNWAVYHKESPASSKGGTANLRLHVDAAADTNSSFWPTQHTEADFNLGDRDESINAAAYTYIAYLFASVPGVSSIGTYTGNGSSVDVDCGFTNGARWFMIKKTNSSGDWYFTSEPGVLQILSTLNRTSGQVNYSSSLAIPSGFNVTSVAGGLCDDGDTYLYMAIA